MTEDQSFLFAAGTRTFKCGVNLSSWPSMKLTQAKAHILALQAEIILWAASEPVSIDQVINEVDDHVVDYVVNIKSPAPVMRWSLILGDVLHNLRSALDSLAWELCHLDGKSPTRPKNVYYPNCQTEKSWIETRKWLASMPPEALAYLDRLQPYHSERPDRVYSSLLMALSNQDKHSVLVACDVALHELETREASFETDPAIEDADPQPRLEGVTTPGPLTHGQIVARIHSPKRVVRVSGSSNVAMNVTVTFGSDTWQVIALAEALWHNTTIPFRVMEGLYNEPDELPEFMEAEKVTRLE